VYRVVPDKVTTDEVAALPVGPRGEGKVVYLILDDQRRVDLLNVMWIS
jgi:hypothetical protein